MGPIPLPENADVPKAIRERHEAPGLDSEVRDLLDAIVALERRLRGRLEDRSGALGFLAGLFTPPGMERDLEHLVGKIREYKVK